MPPRIAIPMPHSSDREYGQRAIPQYERAVELAGGVPVRIPLDQTLAEVNRLVASCQGVLLPGSNADVDPAKFRQSPSPHCAAADERRERVDFLLLDHAYAAGKPILAICYGLQSLNVYRQGSLVQHIPDFLAEPVRSKVDHEAGRKVAVAHTVEIERGSKLAQIVNGPPGDGDSKIVLPVNSSHHQAADVVGEGLRTVAQCPDDGIIEAMEGTSPNHFVLAVQWHPERSVDQDDYSKMIMGAFVSASGIFEH
jgi:putative glutamine amidotransferase